MKVIRTMKPKTGAGAAAATAAKPRAPQQPPPQPQEEGAPVPGSEKGQRGVEPAGVEEIVQEEPEDGPGDEDLVPDE